MTTEGTKKQCTHTGCDGMMTYRATKRPPGSQASISREGGQFMWGGSEKPGGWTCNRDPEHFEADPH